jgi:hypothetical protein
MMNAYLVYAAQAVEDWRLFDVGILAVSDKKL